MLGALAGFAALLLAGELLVRAAPPDDLRPYLGDRSGLAGPYAPDPVLGAGYRSYEAFAADYHGRLEQLADENAGRPVWAMFGNSFVQAPGMLGDTAQRALPQTQIFFLRRNEPLHLRVAQFVLLLENGLRPERAFFVLLPNDLAALGLDPVGEISVTPGGGLGKRAREPEWLEPLFDESRLALLAWVRSGRAGLLPDYDPDKVLEAQPAPIVAQLDTLFGVIAGSARTHGVPVTIVFIPNREQINGDASRTPQQAIGDAARRARLDFFDPTPAFLAEPDKSGLLIADGHLSDRGNALLLAQILAHVGETGGAP